MSDVEQKVLGRDDIRRGFVWLGAATTVARIIDAGAVLVVMWFVSREQIGIATLAWSVSVFLEAMNGMGIPTALLQVKDITEDRLSAAFWYTMGIATLLVVLIAALASPLAGWFGNAQLAPMLFVCTLKLLFVGVAMVPLNQLNRAMNFERLAAVSTLATLAAGTLTCVLAAAGLEAWALVLGQTSHGLFTAVFAQLAYPFRPRFRPTLKPIHAEMVFGAKVAAAGMLHHFYRNADYYIIGRVLGVGAVGLYRVAFDLAMTPTMAIQAVVNRSALPVYSRMSMYPRELADAFLWTLRSLGVLLAPVTGLLLFAADDLLGWVQDGAWLDAAPMVRWLSLAALLRCIAQTFPQVFSAMKRPVFSLYDSLLTMVVLVSLLAVGLYGWGETYGAVIAAWAWALLYPITFIALLTMMGKLLPITPWNFFASLRHPLASLLAIGLAHFVYTATLAPVLPASLGVPAHIACLLLAFLAYVRLAMGVTLRGLLRR